MVSTCCQPCQTHASTIVYFVGNNTNHRSEKRGHDQVRASVEESDLSFPLYGYKGQDHFMGQFGFMAVVESPSVVLIVPKEDSNSSSMRLLSSLFQCWPVMLINLCIVFLSGIVIWFLVSPNMTTLSFRSISIAVWLLPLNFTLRTGHFLLRGEMGWGGFGGFWLRYDPPPPILWPPSHISSDLPPHNPPIPSPAISNEWSISFSYIFFHFFSVTQARQC